LWVLEPERLGLAVTGEKYTPFVNAANARKQQITTQQQKVSFAPEAKSAEPKKFVQKKQRSSKMFDSLTGSLSTTDKKTVPVSTPDPVPPVIEADSKAQRRIMSQRFKEHELAAEVFARKKQFSLYIVDQVNLMTQMCRGRSVNAITHLEGSFSYSLLLNMASNPWLPNRFRAAVVHLVLALYVDRYPQVIKADV
jgi:hypothetical protein